MGARCATGVAPADAKLLTMSTLTEEGVMAVKHVACDRLLASRVEAKLQVGPGLLCPLNWTSCVTRIQSHMRRCFREHNDWDPNKAHCGSRRQV